MRFLQEWFIERAQTLYIRRGVDAVDVVATVFASALLCGAVAMVVSHVA